MLGPEAVPANDSRCHLPGHKWPGGGQIAETAKTLTLSGFLRTRCSARAVEAELDDARRDLAGAVAAGVAGDVELGGEGVEAALGGALGNVQLGGDLGPGGGTAGKGALAAVGGDEGGGGRPLLLAEGDRGLTGGDGGATATP